MAELLAAPDKIIAIDDEDYEKVKDYKWITVDNVSGNIARRLPNGRLIGLAQIILGKRPSPAHKLDFQDKDRRNFRKANMAWSNLCDRCGTRTKDKCWVCSYCERDSMRRSTPYGRYGFVRDISRFQFSELSYFPRY